MALCKLCGLPPCLWRAVSRFNPLKPWSRGGSSDKGTVTARVSLGLFLQIHPPKCLILCDPGCCSTYLCLLPSLHPSARSISMDISYIQGQPEAWYVWSQQTWKSCFQNGIWQPLLFPPVPVSENRHHSRYSPCVTLTSLTWQSQRDIFSVTKHVSTCFLTFPWLN